jgi:hypothetical protein
MRLIEDSTGGPTRNKLTGWEDVVANIGM